MAKAFFYFSKAGMRPLAWLLAVTVVFCCLPFGASAAPAEENWTEIRTAEELYAIRGDLTGRYRLMNDIDLTELTAPGGDLDAGHGWQPIASGDDQRFSGVFDGGGHTIIGLRCDDPDKSVGLFGIISGSVRNLRLEKADLRGAYAGGICDSLFGGEISDCEVNGRIVARIGAGGIAGFMSVKSSAIRRCCASGSISCVQSGKTYGAGGIVGVVLGGTVEQCRNAADVTTADGKEASFICGIAGCVEENHYTYFYDCYNTGIVACNGILQNTRGYTMVRCLNFGSCGEYPLSKDGGIQWYTPTKRDCYYLYGSSGKEDPESTALTPATAKLQGSYPGLDFDNVWFLDLNSGVAHPQLQALPEVSAKSLSLNQNGVKTVYTQNEELDITGLTVNVAYANGKSSVRPVTAAMVSGYDPAVIGKQTVTVTYLGKTAAYTVEVKPIPVTEVRLEREETAVFLYETGYVAPTVLPEDASYQNLIWTSSDPAVASVDEDGVIMGESVGEATVTAEAHNGEKASCKVTVRPHAESVSVEKTLSLFVGKTHQLQAAQQPAEAAEVCTWTSSNRAVATVGADGTVTAVSPGETTVTVTTANGKSAVCQVTVRSGIEKLNVDGCVTIYVGQPVEVLASTTPELGTIDDEVIWTSSDPSIVSVDSVSVGYAFVREYVEYGERYVKRMCSICKLTPHKAGYVTIKAVSGSGVGEGFEVYVESPATAISLEQPSLTMDVGTRTTLNAALTPADSTTMVEWISSDDSIAEVGWDSGIVRAYMPGTVTITAYAGRNISATCTLTVLQPSTGISLDAASVSLYTGQSQTLIPTLTPENSTDVVKWESSDPAVAKVSAAGKVTALAKGTATITASTRTGKKATCKVTVGVAAKEVTLDRTRAEVNVGGTVKLSATVRPEDTTDKLTWISGNTKIATVDQNGSVTAKSVGTVFITAQAGDRFAVCTVSVLQPSTAVKLSKTAAKLNVGGTLALTAALTPGSSTDSLTWRSDVPEVASVDRNGVVTAVARGTAVITVETDSGKTAACEVTVLLPATSVSLDAETLTLGLGETAALHASLLPENTTDTVKWVSGKPAVATVSPAGEITALQPGSARITASTPGGLKAVCTVTVVKRAERISLDRTEALISILGDTVTLTGTVLPEDATLKKLYWSSSNEAVAEVSSAGKVTALAEGEAVIYATNGEGLKKGECRLTVISAPAGDVDGNGKIESGDARLALRRSVGLERYPEQSREYIACDVDGKNGVTAADARLILRASVGLEHLNNVSHYHVYGAATRTEPTCENPGSVRKTCRICGEINETAVKALGHQFEKAPGAKEPVCARCGKTQCAVNGHDWGYVNCTVPAVCKVCGKSFGEAPGHDWKAATCTAPKTCARCGRTEGAALGHDWKAADCDAPKTCARCGATEGKALGHDWKAADCTTPKTCARCGKTEGAVLGHDYAPATYAAPQTCRRCGATVGEPLTLPSDQYAYLAGSDFRAIRNQYSEAVPQAGYAVAYYDANGDLCVLTYIRYKIISNYSATTLHNLTTGATISDPADYYNSLASRAFGDRKIMYWDLSSEVMKKEQMAMQGISDMLSTGNASGSGVYVSAAELNR